ncbi:uncharacterized protein LOC117807720 [Notolabrus celidotus]|uniref:uncharacterized protein LOC117807720 n=1 Tax=Notolabrus celidotus TaxID=1203425 RepID=UPI00148FF8FD|nr:uncharacterized protein LOC117807720 [Notolabrus celidotus]
MSPNTSEFHLHCYSSRPGIFIFTAFTVTSVVFLPLHMFVLHVGYQRWRQQRSVSAAAAAMTSHADVFTFYMVVLEFISSLGCVLYSFGALAEQQAFIPLGIGFLVVTSSGQVLLHLLTCAERYLAVIHPITYRKLKQRGGVKIRNISIGCVCVMCSGSLIPTILQMRFLSGVSTCCFFILALIVASFCSLSVLRVLIRPGPGKVGGGRAQVDQVKRRAFHTITAILGALLLRFASVLISSMVFASEPTHTRCVLGSTMIWFTLPSSLVLPLLFLHRVGKLPGGKHNSESG